MTKIDSGRKGFISSQRLSQKEGKAGAHTGALVKQKHEAEAVVRAGGTLLSGLLPDYA